MKKILFSISATLLAAAATAQVKLGTNPASVNNAALLEMESTNKGMLLPRLSAAQRNAIPSPPAGLTIYNTDAGCPETYNGTAWLNACNTGNGGGTASGSLLGAGGNCTPAAVNGIYTKGTIVNPSGNTVQIQVNVTATGSYFISTPVVNGISFSASGTFTGTGVQNVTLRASGTPAATGSFSYMITYAGTSCTFDVNFVDGSGTLASLSCSGSPTGTYRAGVPTDNSNIMSITVDVATPGTYLISTNIVNGYAFSAAGEFTQTGPQFLVLQASGTPQAAGTNNFTVRFPGYSCPFSVTVAP